jgi:cell division protein FtsB
VTTTNETVAGSAAPEAPPRPFRSLLSAVFVFLVLLLATFGLRGWQDVSRARERERTLAAEVAATEARIAELKRKIERMKNDPVTLDRMARQELGLVSPDDVVIVLPARAAANALPAPPAAR